MTSALEATPFSLTGPLPRGLTVLEASAGTGKTFAIAALTARFVAEGVPLDAILAISFTRNSTGELRERVRARLVSAERALAGAVAGHAPPEDDEIARLLATGSPDEVAERRHHLSRAVADFDAATIATTHAFCQAALDSLGFAGDVAAGSALVEDVSDLVDEVIDDLYLRKRLHEDPGFSRSHARELVRFALASPGAVVEPDPEAPATTARAATRAKLVRAATAEVERRKRQRRIITYDDLLTRLDACLRDDASHAVAARLRSRYRVVLVDEFQDTDPVQWSIMRRAFDHDDATLVLIGDPKQAIYAFRGADVYSYLHAARGASLQTLPVNWRSDGDLLRAQAALFADARLGHPEITFREVRAAPPNEGRRLEGAPDPAALRVRVVDRSLPSLTVTKSGTIQVDSAREHVARDLADDVVGLLSSGARISHPGGDAPEVVQPGDIGVLIRDRWQAALVRDELAAVGVRAVTGGGASVFASDAAAAWVDLLRALERPSSDMRAHAVAITPFFGWSARRVATADADEWESVHRRLHHWASVLRNRGVASLLEIITVGERLAARVLATAGGERVLTDLRHVAQLLHRAGSRDQSGVTSLLAWLQRHVDEAGDTPEDERRIRLESDADAVQILTVHAAKGLEFPIVYCPYLWTPGPKLSEHSPVRFHDPRHGDRYAIEVGIDGADAAGHRTQSLVEERGEELRLAYVALTRARHQATVWWAAGWRSEHAPLTRLVMRDASGDVPSYGDELPSDATMRARFDEIAAATPAGCMSVTSSTFGARRYWRDESPAPPALSSADFDRGIDRAWRRTSYSDMTAGAGHDDPRVASEPESVRERDEPGEGGDEVDLLATSALPDEEAPSLDDEALRAVPSPLAEMPGGTAIGSLVHDVLERTDFAAGDLRAELRERLAAVRGWRKVGAGDEDVLVEGLAGAIETPLGPVAGDVRLRDVTRADRVDEMSFELPLAGGDRPSGAPGTAVTPHAIGAVLREHLAADDPLRAYADRLDDPLLRGRVRGYLTGSIDLAFRVAAPDGRSRYGIVDYKTNRLGDHARPLTLWDHRPAAIREEMFRSHYALQGLLYTVALHRYLRWRSPGHDPDRDLLGVLYLFVRGMAGAETPRVDGTPCGVFAWRPPGALVAALSDLFDEGVGA